MKILLFCPSPALEALAEQAAVAFAAIHGDKPALQTCTTSSQAHRGPYDLALVDGATDQLTVAALIVEFSARSSQPTLVLATPENYRLFGEQSASFPGVYQNDQPWRAELILEFLQHLQLSAAKPVTDMRVLRNVITGIVDVIRSTAGADLVPKSVDKGDLRKQHTDVASVACLYGGGRAFIVSLYAPRALLTTLAGQAVKVETASLAAQHDFTHEIVNQIQGIIKAKMAEVGFPLTAALNLVLSGGQTVQPRLPGQYFYFPFAFQGEVLTISLCHHVPVSMLKAKAFDAGAGVKPGVDVRLLNELDGAVAAVLTRLTGQRPPKAMAERHKPAALQAATLLQVIQMVGMQGRICLTIEMPHALAEALVTAANQATPAGTKPTDAAAMRHKIINLIASTFKKGIERHGYYLYDVFQAEYVADKTVHYSIKNNGFHLHRTFQVGAAAVAVGLCIDSRFGLPMFDAWGYLHPAG